jgi:hypothetical protein
LPEQEGALPRGQVGLRGALREDLDGLEEPQLARIGARWEQP